VTQLRDTWQVIRPCRESEKGWPQKAALPLFSGNHSSLVLIERGTALKVFWSRLRRDGRSSGAPEGACASERVQLKKELTKKKRAGRSQSWSNPAGFFRFEIGQGIRAIQR
jgi:hypothetical protein